MRKPTKVSEHCGWEIYTASSESFSIRKAGQTFGPFESEDAAKEAIDREEGQGKEE